MNALRAWLDQLGSRERIALVGGGILAVGLLIWAWGVAPLFEQVDQLDRVTARKLKAGTELAKVLADYRAAATHGARPVATQDTRGFSLLSFLEGLSARARVKSHIKYMRPTTSDVAEGVREHQVEIQVAQIGLAAMVDLLTAVERSPHGLRVKRLHVKRRFSNPNLLDVTFVVARYEAG